MNGIKLFTLLEKAAPEEKSNDTISNKVIEDLKK